MNEHKFYTVDVFTNSKFGGNPLAVIPNAENLDEKLFQSIANELNLSETTFVLPPVDSNNDYRVRIFTPTVEVPTAGHPTIGTSYVLLNEMNYKPKFDNRLLLEEEVGLITVDFQKVNNIYQDITMNQPLPVFGEMSKKHDLVANLLSIQETDIDKDKPIQSVSCGNNFLFVPVKSIESLQKIKLKLDLFEKYRNEFESINLYVFTMETFDKESDTHARMFAPLFGVIEDPATGSASGPFGCYLVKHGLSNGENIICEQGYEINRPSKINVNIGYKNNEFEYVRVSGNIVTVCEGVIKI